MLLFVVVFFLFLTYHAREYITDDMTLKNGIYTKGIISNNEIYLLENINPSLLS